MLISDETRRENDPGPNPSNDSRQFNDVGRFDFQMPVSIEINEFMGRAQNFRSIGGFHRSLFRRAIRPRFPSRTNYKMGSVSTARLQSDHSTASKFNIIGMRAKCQDRAAMVLRFRHRLHQSDQSGRDKQTVSPAPPPASGRPALPPRRYNACSESRTASSGGANPASV